MDQVLGITRNGGYRKSYVMNGSTLPLRSLAFQVPLLSFFGLPSLSQMQKCSELDAEGAADETSPQGNRNDALARYLWSVLYQL